MTESSLFNFQSATLCGFSKNRKEYDAFMRILSKVHLSWTPRKREIEKYLFEDRKLTEIFLQAFLQSLKGI